MVWSPCPDTVTAKSLANSLLDEQLIVCANILSPIHSIFEWAGERGEAAEVGLLMKTGAELLDAVCERMAELHPYDTPVVIGWEADAASKSALNWIGMMSKTSEGSNG